LQFATNGAGGGMSEKVRITSIGNVGIGTIDPQARLGVQGPINVSQAHLYGGSRFTDASNTNSGGIQIGNSAIGSNALYLEWGGLAGNASIRNSFVNGNVDVVANTNGVRLASNGTSWSSLSDVRLKGYITDSSATLAQILQLRPTEYTMNASGNREIGFIAQEIEALFPSLVSTPAGGVCGETSNAGCKTVTYDRFGVLAITGIQELNVKVDANAISMEGKQLEGLVNIQTQLNDLTDGLTVVQGSIADFGSALANIDLRITDLASRIRAIEEAPAQPVVNNITNTTVIENRNQVGVAQISAGKIGIKISFAEIFEVAPVIYITPTSGNMNFTISAVTKTGFTLHLNETKTTNTTFNWFAAQNNTSNDISEQIDAPQAVAPTGAADPDPVETSVTTSGQ